MHLIYTREEGTEGTVTISVSIRRAGGKKKSGNYGCRPLNNPQTTGLLARDEEVASTALSRDYLYTERKV